MSEPAQEQAIDAQWQWTVPIPESKTELDAAAIAEFLHTHGFPEAEVAVNPTERIAYVNASDDPGEAIALFDDRPTLEIRQRLQAVQRMRDVVTKVNAGSALTAIERDRSIRDLAAIVLRLVRDGN